MKSEINSSQMMMALEDALHIEYDYLDTFSDIFPSQSNNTDYDQTKPSFVFNSDRITIAASNTYIYLSENSSNSSKNGAKKEESYIFQEISLPDLTFCEVTAISVSLNYILIGNNDGKIYILNKSLNHHKNKNIMKSIMSETVCSDGDYPYPITSICSIESEDCFYISNLNGEVFLYNAKQSNHQRQKQKHEVVLKYKGFVSIMQIILIDSFLYVVTPTNLFVVNVKNGQRRCENFNLFENAINRIFGQNELVFTDTPHAFKLANHFIISFSNKEDSYLALFKDGNLLSDSLIKFKNSSGIIAFPLTSMFIVVIFLKNSYMELFKLSKKIKHNSQINNDNDSSIEITENCNDNDQMCFEKTQFQPAFFNGHITDDFFTYINDTFSTSVLLKVNKERQMVRFSFYDYEDQINNLLKNGHPITIKEFSIFVENMDRWINNPLDFQTPFFLKEKSEKAVILKEKVRKAFMELSSNKGAKLDVDDIMIIARLCAKYRMFDSNGDIFFSDVVEKFEGTSDLQKIYYDVLDGFDKPLIFEVLKNIPICATKAKIDPIYRWWKEKIERSIKEESKVNKANSYNSLNNSINKSSEEIISENYLQILDEIDNLCKYLSELSFSKSERIKIENTAKNEMILFPFYCHLCVDYFNNLNDPLDKIVIPKLIESGSSDFYSLYGLSYIWCILNSASNNSKKDDLILDFTPCQEIEIEILFKKINGMSANANNSTVNPNSSGVSSNVSDDSSLYCELSKFRQIPIIKNISKFSKQKILLFIDCLFKKLIENESNNLLDRLKKSQESNVSAFRMVSKICNAVLTYIEREENESLQSNFNMICCLAESPQFMENNYSYSCVTFLIQFLIDFYSQHLELALTKNTCHLFLKFLFFGPPFFSFPYARNNQKKVLSKLLPIFKSFAEKYKNKLFFPNIFYLYSCFPSIFDEDIIRNVKKSQIIIAEAIEGYDERKPIDIDKEFKKKESDLNFDWDTFYKVTPLYLMREVEIATSNRLLSKSSNGKKDPKKNIRKFANFLVHNIVNKGNQLSNISRNNSFDKNLLERTSTAIRMNEVNSNNISNGFSRKGSTNNAYINKTYYSPFLMNNISDINKIYFDINNCHMPFHRKLNSIFPNTTTSNNNFYGSIIGDKSMSNMLSPKPEIEKHANNLWKVFYEKLATHSILNDRTHKHLKAVLLWYFLRFLIRINSNYSNNIKSIKMSNDGSDDIVPHHADNDMQSYVVLYVGDSISSCRIFFIKYFILSFDPVDRDANLMNLLLCNNSVGLVKGIRSKVIKYCQRFKLMNSCINLRDTDNPKEKLELITGYLIRDLLDLAECSPNDASSDTVSNNSSNDLTMKKASLTLDLAIDQIKEYKFKLTGMRSSTLNQMCKNVFDTFRLPLCITKESNANVSLVLPLFSLFARISIDLIATKTAVKAIMKILSVMSATQFKYVLVSLYNYIEGRRFHRATISRLLANDHAIMIKEIVHERNSGNEINLKKNNTCTSCGRDVTSFFLSYVQFFSCGHIYHTSNCTGIPIRKKNNQNEIVESESRQNNHDQDNEIFCQNSMAYSECPICNNIIKNKDIDQNDEMLNKKISQLPIPSYTKYFMAKGKIVNDIKKVSTDAFSSTEFDEYVTFVGMPESFNKSKLSEFRFMFNSTDSFKFNENQFSCSFLNI